jgi:hypothetical protein
MAGQAASIRAKRGERLTSHGANSATANGEKMASAITG